eukprot:Phypoly_transcript_10887.p1 GENE.Phypoly_transcript_10887~~Phypoly_transcript_10887.p1  ORF type:complete len:284 (+),score=33.67 Phypoly_transcript_10887:52-852(+)
MNPATVLCFGDSWTHGNSVALTDHLQACGHQDTVRVISKDYWGSTAEYFAQHSQLLPDAVEKYNAEHVLLSMGGNDYKNIYWRQRRYIAPWKAVAEIEGNLRIVLDALFARHPHTKVVTYGYDFPGDIAGFITGSLWNGKEPENLSYTVRLLLFLYNYVGVRLINTSLMRLGGVYEKLSKEYAKKGHTFTYVPLWGTLQKAALAEAKDAKYKMGSPSPLQFMNDPIHANYEGFTHLLTQLYLNYFKSHFAPESTSSPTLTLPAEVC